MNVDPYARFNDRWTNLLGTAACIWNGQSLRCRSP